MRITSETMVARSLERLQTRMAGYERSQSQLATGKRMLRPSDDPASARRAMTLRAQMRSREREIANADEAAGHLGVADTQLQAARTRLAKVLELTVAGANEGSPASRRALASEVRAVRDELVGMANTTHQGRPVFGGFTAGPAVEQVGGVWTSNGGGDAVMRRVGDAERVQVNVTAHEWLGFGAGADTISLLDDLANRLETDGPEAVGQLIGDVRAAGDHVGEALAKVGTAGSRVDGARQRAQDMRLTLRNELSEVENLDVAEGVMELQTQQVAFEATLQALSRALPPSLVSFLR